MLKEYGPVEGIPGMESSETYIEEETKYNPNCPCGTRTCPQHGFCKECIAHHEWVKKKMASHGLKGDSPVCMRLRGK